MPDVNDDHLMDLLGIIGIFVILGSTEGLWLTGRIGRPEMQSKSLPSDVLHVTNKWSDGFIVSPNYGPTLS